MSRCRILDIFSCSFTTCVPMAPGYSSATVIKLCAAGCRDSLPLQPTKGFLVRPASATSSVVFLSTWYRRSGAMYAALARVGSAPRRRCDSVECGNRFQRGQRGSSDCVRLGFLLKLGDAK